MVKKITLIEPVEWEDTHIESHKKINKGLNILSGCLEDVEKVVDNLSKEIKNIKENISDKKDINKLKDNIKTLWETVGSIVSEIKNLNEKVNRRRKYYVQTYEWILDTNTQIVTDLDSIELDEWTYLVNIVEHEVVANWWVNCYSLWKTTLTSVSYTPHIYLQAKSWEKAVLEYDFSVIITEV